MLELSKRINVRAGARPVGMVKLTDIHMRDPFIYTDRLRKLYFLFGTTMEICDGSANLDPYFEVYVSDDLINFEGPYVAYAPEKGFWGVKHYWAPEVYEYKGAYYMLATFKGGIKEDRGTAILKADFPEGPYREHSKGHVTLKGHECLDGTLYVDDGGKPWIIFCHEWTEIFYGKIKALPLKDDLTEALTQDAVTIIDTETDDIPWIRQTRDARVNKCGYLTDAPFIYKETGKGMTLLWSSYSVKGYAGKGSGGYVVALCKNPGNDMRGPWIHEKKLLLDENTGHSSLFRDLGGSMCLISHANDTCHGNEYPKIFRIDESGESIKITD